MTIEDPAERKQALDSLTERTEAHHAATARLDDQLEGQSNIDDAAGAEAERKIDQQRTRVAFDSITRASSTAEAAGPAVVDWTEEQQHQRDEALRIIDETEQEEQKAAVEEQIEAEKPEDVFAGAAETLLTKLATEGDPNEAYNLGPNGADPFSEAYRKGLTAFFARHDLEDPLPALEQVKKGILGRDKHASTGVHHQITVGEEQIVVEASRHWAKRRGAYFYQLQGMRLSGE